MFKINKFFVGLVILIFMLASCSDNAGIDRSMARVLGTIITVTILGLILNPIIARTKKKRRNNVNQYIDQLKTKVQNNNDELEFTPLEFDYVAATVPGIYQWGCATIGVGLFISWILLWIGIFSNIPVLIYLFVFLLVLMIVWLSLSSVLKKQIKVNITIAKDFLKISDYENSQSISINPNEIQYLRLFEKTTNNKGINQTIGAFIEIRFNLHSNKEKLDLFFNMVGQYRLPKNKMANASETLKSTILNQDDIGLLWNEYNIIGRNPIIINGRWLKTELINFCVSNNIEIKNEIGTNL